MYFIGWGDFVYTLYEVMDIFVIGGVEWYDISLKSLVVWVDGDCLSFFDGCSVDL